MKFLDLSHTITPGMPVYPGTEEPIFVKANTIAQHGFAEKKLSLYSHTGTHIDAPAHILEDQLYLDDLSLDNFIGQALCIPCDQPQIGIDLFQPYEDVLDQLDFLLLATGWSKYWGEMQYFSDYPVLNPSAAEYLCQFSLKGIGFDTISADSENSTAYPVHKILLQQMIIIENLTGLDQVAGQKFLFSCLPLKIAQADGSPVRAVAILDATEANQ